MFNYFKRKKIMESVKKAVVDNKQYYLYLLGHNKERLEEASQQDAQAIYRDILKAFNKRTFLTLKDYYQNTDKEVFQQIELVENNLEQYGLGSYDEVIELVGYTPLVQLMIVYMAATGKVYNYNEAIKFDGVVDRIMRKWGK